jgi:hypothetical protein
VIGPSAQPSSQLTGGDPELGNVILRPVGDPELGKILVTPRVIPPKPQPKSKSVFLRARADYFHSSNVYSASDLRADGLMRSGLSLTYQPTLGPNTYLIGAIEGNLIRYTQLSDLNYNESRLRVGVLQRLSPRMYGEIGWSRQQLFVAEPGLGNLLGGRRFFNDHSLRFELSRQDPLTPKLALNTFYQLRWSITDRLDNNRLSNTLITSLSYDVTPKVIAGLDYQLNWSHYTSAERDDLFHQVLGRVTYKPITGTQLNLFAGYSFGRSSEARAIFGRSGDSALNFSGFLFGGGLVIDVPLF